MEKWTLTGPDGEDLKLYYSFPERMQNTDLLIINFHGGGFIRGRTDSDELFCRRMNHALSCKVLDVDYSIAPDYPFPIAVHEAYAVLTWVLQHAADLGIDPKKIVAMGHSAGGTLVIGAIMRSLEEGTPLPALLVVQYPPLDIYTDPLYKKRLGSVELKLRSIIPCTVEPPFQSGIKFGGVKTLHRFRIL